MVGSLPTLLFLKATTFNHILILAGAITLVNIFINPAFQAIFANMTPRAKRGARAQVYNATILGARTKSKKTNHDKEKVLIRCERKLEVLSFDFYILGNKKRYVDKLLADGGKEHINV